jgi:hypothetical protein
MNYWWVNQNQTYKTEVQGFSRPEVQRSRSANTPGA